MAKKKLSGLNRRQVYRLLRSWGRFDRYSALKGAMFKDKKRI